MILIGWLLKWLWLAVFGKALRLGDWKEQECKNKNSSELHQNQYNINTLQQLPINNIFFKEHDFLLILYCLVGTYFPLYTVSFLVHSACPLSIGFFSMTNSSFESGTATWAVWCATNDHYFFFCIIIFYALSIYVWYAFNFKLGFPPKIPC